MVVGTGSVKTSEDIRSKIYPLILTPYFRYALYFDLDPVDLTSGVGAVGPVSTCEVHICEGNVPWALDLE